MSPSQPSTVISASQFLYEVAAGWEPPLCEDSEALAVNHLKDSEEKPFPELYSVGWAAEGRVVHMRRVSKRLLFFDLTIPAMAADPGALPGEDRSPNREASCCDGRSLPEKVEVIVRYPGCSDIRAISAGVRVGDVVAVSGEWVEKLPGPGLPGGHSRLLFHASTASVLDRCQARGGGAACVQRPVRGVDFFPRGPGVTGKEGEEESPTGRAHAPAGASSGGSGGTGAAWAGGLSLSVTAGVEVAAERHVAANHGLAAQAPGGDGGGGGAVCKFWVNTGRCAGGARCPFLHPEGCERGRARALWAAARREHRSRHLASPGDPLDPHDKARHGRRARVFARWLVDQFTREVLVSGDGVLDIAGGRGALSFHLQAVLGVPATIVDPRPWKPMKLEHRFRAANPEAALPPVICARFEYPPASSDPEECGRPGSLGTCVAPAEHENFAPDRTGRHEDGNHEEEQEMVLSQVRVCREPVDWEGVVGRASCLVGLHPDEATEAIVCAALAHRKPFAVVPCCVFPRLFPGRVLVEGGAARPVESHAEFVRYLQAMCLREGGRAETAWLNVEGQNQVVFCREYL